MVRHCSVCGRRGHDKRHHIRGNPDFFTKDGVVHPIRNSAGYSSADAKGDEKRAKTERQRAKGSPATAKAGRDADDKRVAQESRKRIAEERSKKAPARSPRIKRLPETIVLVKNDSMGKPLHELMLEVGKTMPNRTRSNYDYGRKAPERSEKAGEVAFQKVSNGFLTNFGHFTTDKLEAVVKHYESEGYYRPKGHRK